MRPADVDTTNFVPRPDNVTKLKQWQQAARLTVTRCEGSSAITGILYILRLRETFLMRSSRLLILIFISCRYNSISSILSSYPPLCWSLVAKIRTEIRNVCAVKKTISNKCYSSSVHIKNVENMFEIKV